MPKGHQLGEFGQWSPCRRECELIDPSAAMGVVGVADTPLDERLNALAESVAATVEDEDTAGAIIEALAAAADAYQAGDIEAAHAQMHDALEILAALADAADGDLKPTLEALATELGACMEETAGILLGDHIQARLG